MIQSRIDLLRETLFDAAQGSPKKLTFYENKNSSLKGFTEASFLIAGKSVIYNNRLKLIDRMLLGYLQDTVDIRIEPIDQQPWQTAIMVDLQLLIWNSLLHLSEYEAQSLFVGQDNLLVTRAETKNNILDLANRDQSDNMVFYYFYYRPKTIGNFQTDYPANQITFYRSLLRLAVGGYLRITDSKGSTGGATTIGSIASTDASSMNVQQAPPVTTKKISGLKKILNAIKNI
ncbi:MAG: hypothetical protein HGB19_10935 [Chlorobiales bacterium]|jgi:hypothetical protein|nr:hypothetical protein [Chlorobiales bacterium]